MTPPDDDIALIDEIEMNAAILAAKWTPELAAKELRRIAAELEQNQPAQN